jgi:adenosylmethionine-8-amino-7-oxononanoate aminotransferase
MCPRKFYSAALDRGLLLRSRGNAVYFTPSHLIEEGTIEMLVEAPRKIPDRMS